jgi:hypothetical protein
MSNQQKTANPTGAGKKAGLRMVFDSRLKLEFHGSKITSDAGLLAYRELDEALGLTDLGDDMLNEWRTGKITCKSTELEENHEKGPRCWRARNQMEKSRLKYGGQLMNTPDNNPKSSEIRKRGLKKLTGGLVFVAIAFLMVWLNVHHYINLYVALIPVLIVTFLMYPTWFFICGAFLELVTGSPFSQIARKWMALRGWQRGVLGSLIVLATAVFSFLIMAFFQWLSAK